MPCAKILSLVLLATSLQSYEKGSRVFVVYDETLGQQQWSSAQISCLPGLMQKLRFDADKAILNWIDASQPANVRRWRPIVVRFQDCSIREPDSKHLRGLRPVSLDVYDHWSARSLTAIGRARASVSDRRSNLHRPVKLSDYTAAQLHDSGRQLDGHRSAYSTHNGYIDRATGFFATKLKTTWQTEPQDDAPRATAPTLPRIGHNKSARLWCFRQVCYGDFFINKGGAESSGTTLSASGTTGSPPKDRTGSMIIAREGQES
ncbi:hypothetical protein TKK_0003908 [Trichogramma kaykai]